MLVRQLLRDRRLFNLRPPYVIRKKSQEAVETTSTINEVFQLPADSKKQPARDPFVKNMFMRIFDTEMINLREPQPHDRYLDFLAWIGKIENYVSSCESDGQKLDKQEILLRLRDLDVFKAAVHEDYDGLNLNETEMTKLVEAVSTIPWLGTYLLKNNILPIRLLSTHGSHDLKREYLPKIMSGELTPAMCLLEEESGVNFRNIATEAKPHENGLLLNGKKTFVVNGVDSNLFIVFAKCYSVEGKTLDLNDTLTMLLVERDFGGITCTTQYNTIGYSHAPMCTVSFENTIVPKKNVIGKFGLGYKVMLEALSPGYQNIAGQAITMLRNFLDQLIVHVIDKRHFDKDFYKYDNTRDVLGNIAFSLYSMESVAYLTAQIADTFENQDLELERAIRDTVCANECVKSIYAGLQLIGRESCLAKYPYMKMCLDALPLITVDMYNIDSIVHIPLLGLQHTGKSISKQIYAERNPGFHPIRVFKYAREQWRKKDLFVKDNLHPSMQMGGDNLEECIHLLSAITIEVFRRYGAEVSERHVELAKLTEIISQIYVLTACLSRASRSYCIGLASGEEERNMVIQQSFEIKRRLKAMELEVEDQEYFSGPTINKLTVDYMYQKHKYALDHPLNKSY